MVDRTRQIFPAALAALLMLCGCGGSGGDDTDDDTGDDDTAERSPDPFVDGVVSVTYGEGAGFSQDLMPEIVFGPPVGMEDPTLGGSTDVVSLGIGGEISVAFTDIEVVDGDGPDFLVFENPFWPGGDETRPFAEPGIVSVSEDGTTWHEFPCDYLPEDENDYTFTGCAGWHAVYSSPSNDIPATDPELAGGDPFDLAELGLARARFVRIVDCGTGALTTPSSGFDLDAVAVVNGAPIVP